MTWLQRLGRRLEAAPLDGLVFRWDLDKTYLKSEFDRVRDLVRIPFERAADKIAAPGVAALIRALREDARRRDRDVRVYFLTASPPQIGRAIKEKLTLDGIEYDGIAFKNQLQNIVRGKFRNLREQVGFKLSELLLSRSAVPSGSREVLFGDDWESDPLVYSLYADILAGRVERQEVEEVLQTIHVDSMLISKVLQAMEELPQHFDAVVRIYINLERRTPPANFRWFGARLVPTFNYFQTAACLFADGCLDSDGVCSVARSLLEQSGYTPARLVNSLADVVRRGHVSAEHAAEIRQGLQAQGLVGKRRRPRPLGERAWWQRLLAWVRTRRGPAGSGAEPIDYRAVVAEWRPAR